VIAALAAACAMACGSSPPPPATTVGASPGHYEPSPAWIELAPVPSELTHVSLADWAWQCAANTATARAWLTSQIVVDRQRKDIIMLSCHNDHMVELNVLERTFTDRLAELPDTAAELRLTANAFATTCERVRTITADAGACTSDLVIVEGPPIDLDLGDTNNVARW
jgi:hypothetical protein